MPVSTNFARPASLFTSTRSIRTFASTNDVDNHPSSLSSWFPRPNWLLQAAALVRRATLFAANCKSFVLRFNRQDAEIAKEIHWFFVEPSVLSGSSY